MQKNLFLSTVLIFFLTITITSDVHAQGLSLTLDKEIFYIGETVRVEYSFTDEGEEAWPRRGGGVRHYMVLSSSEEDEPFLDISAVDGNLASGVWEYSTVNPVPRSRPNLSIGNVAAMDYFVILSREHYDKIAEKQVETARVKKYFRLRQPKAKPMPEAMVIHGGSRFKAGDTLKVSLNIPEELMEHYNFRLEAYRLNRRTKGGAIRADDDKYHMSFADDFQGYVQSARQEIIVMDQISGVFEPGLYELRLTQNFDRESGAGEFVIASAQFETVVEPWASSIKIPNPNDTKVGDQIKFRINRNAVPYKFREGYSTNLDVYTYRVEEGILGSDYMDFDVGRDGVKLKVIHWEESITTDLDYESYVVFEKPGLYLFQLVDQDRYIVDMFEIEVTGRQELSDIHIGTGNTSYFPVGEKIPVEIFVENDYGSKVTAHLYHTSVDDDYNRGEPIDEWDVEVGKKMAFHIQEGLQMGTYTLIIEFAPEDETLEPSVQASAQFQVVPPFDTVKIDLGGKEHFLSGEEMNIKLVLPEGMDAKNWELNYSVTKISGFVPGCARQKEIDVLLSSFEEGQLLQSITAPFPGEYVFRLTGGLKDLTTYREFVFLAEKSFSVDTQWVEGGISMLGGTSVNYKDPIVVETNVPNNLGFAAEDYNDQFKSYFSGIRMPTGDKYVMQVFRQADVSYGGAHRFESHQILSKLMGGKDQWTLNEESLNALVAGSYEFRLYNFDHYKGGLVIARLPFDVIRPDSPFPVERGKPGGRRRSNIEMPGMMRGLNIGHSLSSDECGESLLEPVVEKMDLKFVRFLDGAYVDVPEPIDFGAGFFLQGQLEEEASRNSYLITLTTPEGDQQEVALFPLEDDPTIVRSERLYLIWHPEEDGEVSE